MAFIYTRESAAHIVASERRQRTLTFVSAIVVVCNDFSGHPHAVQLWGRSQQSNFVCSALICYYSVVREQKCTLDAFSDALKFSFITSPHYQQNC